VLLAAEQNLLLHFLASAAECGRSRGVASETPLVSFEELF
jgi:hypothetical protein